MLLIHLVHKVCSMFINQLLLRLAPLFWEQTQDCLALEVKIKVVYSKLSYIARLVSPQLTYKHI